VITRNIQSTFPAPDPLKEAAFSADLRWVTRGEGVAAQQVRVVAAIAKANVHLNKYIK